MTSEENFDVELFIDAIKNYPEIWNISFEMYHDRVKKRSAWIKICEMFSEAFLEKDDREKNEILPINNDLERRIADAFEVFDHAGNKTVDVREVGTIIRGLGCCPTEAEVQEIVMAVEDHEAPGSVHLSKFLPYIAQVIAEHRYEPASPEDLLEAFRVLDPEQHGFITKDNISTLMTQDGEPFNQDELDEMLEIAIDPHTQTVPYEYYINQLMYEPQEGDIYGVADRVEAEKPPPPPPPRRMSEYLRMTEDII